MSQENVEIVKESYARAEGGDYEGMLDLWHPEAEWVEGPRVPGAVTRRGPRRAQAVPRKHEQVLGVDPP